MTMFQNKHVLVDTCVLSYIFKSPDIFAELLNEFAKVKCNICINVLLRLEFVRSAIGKAEKDKFDKFLNEEFLTIPVDSVIYKMADELYPLYNYCGSIRNQRQVSVVDTISASFLKKYDDGLFLLTLDNSDYPLEILDRVKVGAIDAGKQILTWGIYRFNPVKFQEKMRRFEGVGNKL